MSDVSVGLWVRELLQAITWLGHSTFLLRTPGGKRLMFDPWLAGNPACPEPFKQPPPVDVILAADICYEKPLADRVMAWLRDAQADPGHRQLVHHRRRPAHRQMGRLHARVRPAGGDPEERGTPGTGRRHAHPGAAHREAPAVVVEVAQPDARAEVGAPRGGPAGGTSPGCNGVTCGTGPSAPYPGPTGPCCGTGSISRWRWPRCRRVS